MRASGGGQQSVRIGDWKGIRQNMLPAGEGKAKKGKQSAANGGDMHVQLYNLKADPHETKDVSADHPEIVAKIEPVKPAEVDVDFLARRLVIMLGGKPMPLVVILSDTILPGAKRRYELGGSIQAAAPFRVTYEVRPEDSTTVLANTVVER